MNSAVCLLSSEMLENMEGLGDTGHIKEFSKVAVMPIVCHGILESVAMS